MDIYVDRDQYGALFALFRPSGAKRFFFEQTDAETVAALLREEFPAQTVTVNPFLKGDAI